MSAEAISALVIAVAAVIGFVIERWRGKKKDKVKAAKDAAGEIGEREGKYDSSRDLDDLLP